MSTLRKCIQGFLDIKKLDDVDLAAQIKHCIPNYKNVRVERMVNDYKPYTSLRECIQDLLNVNNVDDDKLATQIKHCILKDEFARDERMSNPRNYTPYTADDFNEVQAGRTGGKKSRHRRKSRRNRRKSIRNRRKSIRNRRKSHKRK